MTKYSTVKSLLNGAVFATLLAGSALAQEPPVLIGNFSSNIDGAVNLGSGPATQPAPATVTTWTRSFGFNGQQHMEERPLGNYSANVRMEDVRGR